MLYNVSNTLINHADFCQSDELKVSYYCCNLLFLNYYLGKAYFHKLIGTQYFLFNALIFFSFLCSGFLTYFAC